MHDVDTISLPTSNLVNYNDTIQGNKQKLCLMNKIIDSSEFNAIYSRESQIRI